MLNTDTRTRQDGLAIELAIDTIQLLARRALGAELEVVNDALGRPRHLRGIVRSHDTPEAVSFAVVMHHHGFLVVFDHSPSHDVIVVVDPWACRSDATPERRLELAARLSEQHGAAEAAVAIAECERETKRSRLTASRCSHAMCDVPRRREDAVSSGYVHGLGQTCAYLEYLTSTSNLPSSGDVVDQGTPSAVSPALTVVPPASSSASQSAPPASPSVAEVPIVRGIHCVTRRDSGETFEAAQFNEGTSRCMGWLMGDADANGANGALEIPVHRRGGSRASAAPGEWILLDRNGDLKVVSHPYLVQHYDCPTIPREVRLGSVAARRRYRTSTAYGTDYADTLELALASAAWLLDRPVRRIRMLEVTSSRWHLTDHADAFRVGTIEMIST